METPQLTEQVRKRLVALIAEDRPDGDRLLRRLREFRTLEGVPACSAVVQLLAHLCFRENEAEQLLSDLLDHRGEIGRSLSRDPGLRVAAMDYLSNIRPLLRNPAVVEHSELRRNERSAITDDLTGLYSRRHAGKSLEIELRRSARSLQPLSVLTLDLDSFRSVNNLYGHPFGDLVLQRVGAVLRRSVRDCDLAARRGGEEFLVLLPQTDRLSAFAVAERFRVGIERHFDQHPIGNRAIAMTVSGGVASHPRDGDDAAMLLERADQALQQSKIHGRNKITIYHSERRLAVRYPVRPPVPVTLLDANRLARSRGRLINLSCGGALIQPGQGHDPQLADYLQFALEPRFRVAGAEPLIVSGRVVRLEASEEIESREGRGRSRDRRVAMAFERPISEEGLARNPVVRLLAAGGETGVITRDESEGIRERLLAILNEDAHNTQRLLDRLEAVGRETGVDAYSALLLILTRLAFDEQEARRHWSAILDNREELSAGLGREVGARVAVLDYFMNINRRLVKPTLIDLELQEAGDEDGTLDPLTGLLTAQMFRSQVQSETRRARRYRLPASVVLLDLDRFAEANDRLGNLVADRILRETADLMTACSRDIDRVARPGEDEFALLLPETPRHGAQLVAERLRARFEAAFAEREGRPLGLTLSAGLAAYPDDATSPEGLLESAAQALYQAKALGKNRVELYQPERRRYLRHDLEPGWFEVEVLAPVDQGAVNTRNLSRNGILFGSPEPIEVGEEIEIRLVDDKGDSGGEALRVRGWVVRLEELPDPEPLAEGEVRDDDTHADRYEIGVAFDRARSESADRLMGFLARTRAADGLEPGPE